MMKRKRICPVIPFCVCFVVIFSAMNGAGKETISRPILPDPDGKPPDFNLPVKVFILLGQSNMVGMGTLGGDTKKGPDLRKGTLKYLTRVGKKYPYLVDDAGRWTVRSDVYFFDARKMKGSPLSPTSNGKTFGPELGFGYVMGYVLDEPVLLIKSCIGNRSLGWDLLPPGSKPYEFNGRIYAGYGQSPSSWVEGEPKKKVNWYAGKQYDIDVANAKKVLNNLEKYYPDYKGQGYEIAGFVFWQGHKDQNSAHAAHYEENLVRFIKSLRKDFHAPNAKFVLATIAFNGWKLSGHGLTIANAQLAVSGERGKYPEFAGNVKTVEARDFWRDATCSPKKQGYHYNRNAETYMEVGLALGWAMADLLQQ